MHSESEYVLEMNNIEKEYFGNKVLKNVSIRVKPGEVLALIGENGAGKSTIMNILFGMPVISQTGGFQGEIKLDGKPIQIQSPIHAMKLGIGMVHQEFMLIDNFNVAENIKINRENLRDNPVSAVFGKSMKLVDQKKMREESRCTLDSLGIKLNETSIVGSLAVGSKQFVEIARELDKQNIKLIVLDEPTAVLTESESEQFLNCVKTIVKKGISVIFISHKLDEIVNNADHVAILRDGELVGEYETKELDVIKMSELMVGREIQITNRLSCEEKKDAPNILKLENFTVHMPSERCNSIDLEIKEGDIFGIGGLAGHGKASVAAGIMGLYPSHGNVYYKGKPLDIRNTRETLKCGIAFVSEDRRGVGLMMDESIEQNITTQALFINNDFMNKLGFFTLYDKKGAVCRVEQFIEELDIRCTGPKQPVRRLSGGNQQKVCLAKALLMNSNLLMISEPTRGIDIGAKKMILDLLIKLNQEQNMTILVTSSELAELRSTCSKIAIMTEGKIAGILKPNDPDYMYGMLMSGVSKSELERMEK